MNKILSLLSFIGSNIKYTLNGKRCTFKGKQIVDHESAVNSYMDVIQKKGFQSAFIDETATQIIYEGLLVSQKIKKDYSGVLYSTVAYKMNISFHSLTFKVLNHIATSYVQAFKKLNAAFITPSRRMRYIIKCAPKGILYFWYDSVEDVATQLPLFFTKKRVMVLSDHADLMKVQFVRLKSQDRESFNYSLMCLDPKEIIDNTDRSLFFETVDALSMKMLNFSFDVILVHQDVYSLPLMAFFRKMGVPCLVVDDTIYGMYNIAKTHKQIGYIRNKENLLFLEDYDKEINPDFDATIYLSKMSVKDGNK